MNQKWLYLTVSLKKWLLRQGMHCPSCGHDQSINVCRKCLVTSLCRCERCKLLFRAPFSTAEENDAYYQRDYQEGFTTEMPAPDELERLKKAVFKGSPKDFLPHVELFRALGIKAGSNILDFGCSWGYGSWQFMQAGFSVKGFEISAPRRDYARNQLGVDILPELDTRKGTFDVVFSSHVLEHVPAVGTTLETMLALLKPGGYLVAVTPCGSAEYRAKDPYHWKRAWGLKHPNFLDDIYYREFFRDKPYAITTANHDVDWFRQWAGSPIQAIGPLDGNVLTVVVKNSAL